MNWGKGIVIGMGVFMSFITVLVVILMSQNVDLESEDYYQREINYEQELSAMRNAEKQEKQIKVARSGEYVVVQVPDSVAFTNVSVYLRRPNNSKDDQFFKLNNSKNLLIPMSKLRKGTYGIEISYYVGDKPCLQKENLTL
jgi:hypothetical protein